MNTYLWYMHLQYIIELSIDAKHAPGISFYDIYDVCIYVCIENVYQIY